MIIRAEENPGFTFWGPLIFDVQKRIGEFASNVTLSVLDEIVAYRRINHADGRKPLLTIDDGWAFVT